MTKRLLTLLLAVMVVLVPLQASAGWRREELRFQRLDGNKGYSYIESVRLIKAAAAKFGVNPDVPLRIYGCETGHPYEYPHSDPYHGPYQYMTDTFRRQQAIQPAIVNNYNLSHDVHNVKANIVTAVGYMRYDTSPWPNC